MPSVNSWFVLPLLLLLGCTTPKSSASKEALAGACIGPSQSVYELGETDQLIEETVCAPATADRDHCLFIDPENGDDGNDGSYAKPLKSLGMVFIFNSTYPPIRLDRISGPKTVVLRGGRFSPCPSPTDEKACIEIMSIKDLTLKNFPGEPPRVGCWKWRG